MILTLILIFHLIDLDLIVKGSSNNPLFKTDSSTNRIGMFGVGSPTADLHIAGDVFISGSNGHITASGNISSSGNVRASRFEIDSATHYIDTSAGNMFVVATGDIAAQPGTGKSLVVTGGISATTNITASGNISASGDVTADNLYTSQYIYHTDDSNTYLNFSPDRLRFNRKR